MNEQNTEETKDLATEEEAVVLPDIPIPGEESITETEESEKSEEAKPESQEVSEDDKNQKPKKQNPFSKRLRKKNDRIQELEEQLAEKNRPAEPSPELESKLPNPDDYEHGINDINYINDNAKAVALEAADERIRNYEKEKKQEAEQTVINQTIQQAQENFNDSMKEAWDKHDDYNEVWDNGGFNHQNDGVMHALKSHKNAGELTYQILKDPKLSAEIEQMDAVSAIVKIAEMGANIKSVSKPKAKSQTGMPAPFEPLDTSKPNSRPQFSEDMSNDQFAARFPIEF